MSAITKVVIAGVVVFSLGCIIWQQSQSPSPPAPSKPKTSPVANHDHACSALVVISIAQKTYSAKTGRGGNANFATNLASLTDEVRDKIGNAFDYPGHNPEPYDGYIFSLAAPLSLDDAKTNFHVFAKPVKGFIGTTLEIDQSETLKDIKL